MTRQLLTFIMSLQVTAWRNAHWYLFMDRLISGGRLWRDNCCPSSCLYKWPLGERHSGICSSIDLFRGSAVTRQLLSFTMSLQVTAWRNAHWYLFIDRLIQGVGCDVTIDLFLKKKDRRVIPILQGQTCRWLHTLWMNCSLFRDRLPVSQVPQERFTTIFTIFWVSFGCFDLRFSEHHK